MISRRNFFSIAAVMLVVLFMFQFTNTAMEIWNDYKENENAVDVLSLTARSGVFTPEDGLPWGTARSGVACIGGSESRVAQMTANWAAYTKRYFISAASLADFAPGTEVPELIVLDGARLDWSEAACQTLLDYAAQGASLVFATLPEVSVLQENQNLRDLLGIDEVRALRTRVQGLHLYKGFLLGGEAVYRVEKETDIWRQDLALEMPWYVLGPGTKVYMKGIFEETAQSEDSPVVIWRRSLGGAYVFAVNGDYMEDAIGLGLLSAMVSEINECTVYPVVNAQSLILADYPSPALENGETLAQYYGRDMQGLYRDLLWPDVTAAYLRGELGLTCMMSVRFDYSNGRLPDRDQLAYYMKRIRELGGELGLSLTNVSDTPVVERISVDLEFMRQAGLEYTFTALYGEERELDDALNREGLSGVRTVVSPYDGGSDVVGYQSEWVTRQTAVADSFAHTYRSDFRVRSVETALAYTGVLAEVSRVAYPNGTEDTWNVLAHRLAASLSSGWKCFEAFDAATVSQCDGRIRDFLALDYTCTREGDLVSIRHTGSGTVWFLLRASGRTVESVTGGSVRQVERGVYLIEAVENNVEAVLGSEHPY